MIVFSFVIPRILRLQNDRGIHLSSAYGKDGSPQDRSRDSGDDEITNFMDWTRDVCTCS